MFSSLHPFSDTEIFMVWSWGVCIRGALVNRLFILTIFQNIFKCCIVDGFNGYCFCTSTFRPFCVGKKNWVMIDTIAGAQSSAIIYSIAETAKANNLKPYNYFEYLLTEIPKHMDDHDVSFCEDLLTWSDKLPEECKK